MTRKTYQMVYVCLNCGQRLAKDIPFGESAPYIGKYSGENQVCEYCGCENFSHPFHPDDPRAKKKEDK